MDHHRFYPYGTLWSNINLGAGDSPAGTQGAGDWQAGRRPTRGRQAGRQAGRQGGRKKAHHCSGPAYLSSLPVGLQTHPRPALPSPTFMNLTLSLPPLTQRPFPLTQCPVHRHAPVPERWPVHVGSHRFELHHLLERQCRRQRPGTALTAGYYRRYQEGQCATSPPCISVHYKCPLHFKAFPVVQALPPLALIPLAALAPA